MADSLNSSTTTQKTAIVTGATGGLGRNLTETLLAQGWKVIACGRNTVIGSHLDTTFHAFDLVDKRQTLAHFCPADVVFHCSALSSPWGRNDSFYQANVVATQNVIEAMRQYNIAKLVHVSTPSIYFEFNDKTAIKEDFLPKKFVNYYAKTKYLAEQAVLSATDINCVILRPRGIFGKYDAAVMPRLLKVAEKGFLPLIKRHGRHAGDALLDITYVENVVQAMLLAYEMDISDSMAFNISNGEPQRLEQIYQLLVTAFNLNVKLKDIPYPVLFNVANLLERKAELGYRLFGVDKEPLMTRYTVGAIAFDQTLDISRAKAMLGYEPKISLEEGLQRSLAYYQGLNHAS